MVAGAVSDVFGAGGFLEAWASARASPAVAAVAPSLGRLSCAAVSVFVREGAAAAVALGAFGFASVASPFGFGALVTAFRSRLAERAGIDHDRLAAPPDASDSRFAPLVLADAGSTGTPHRASRRSRRRRPRRPRPRWPGACDAPAHLLAQVGRRRVTGCMVSTVPSEGISHDSPPLLLKPRSSSCAAFTRAPARTARRAPPRSAACRRASPRRRG